MYLFLQGPSRVGKSTIVRNALAPYRGAVAGLMTQRLFRGGQLCGFCARVVGGGALPPLEAPYTGDGAGVFLLDGAARPGVLEDAIARAGAQCARPSCRFVVLDEIGGLELASPGFMQPLSAILALGKPCAGVLKSHENLVHTAQKLGLPQSVLRQRDELQGRLVAGGSVLTVREGNLAETARRVNAFVAENIEKTR